MVSITIRNHIRTSGCYLRLVLHSSLLSDPVWSAAGLVNRNQVKYLRRVCTVRANPNQTVFWCKWFRLTNSEQLKGRCLLAVCLDSHRPQLF